MRAISPKKENKSSLEGLALNKYCQHLLLIDLRGNRCAECYTLGRSLGLFPYILLLQAINYCPYVFTNFVSFSDFILIFELSWTQKMSNVILRATIAKLFSSHDESVLRVYLCACPCSASRSSYTISDIIGHAICLPQQVKSACNYCTTKHYAWLLFSFTNMARAQKHTLLATIKSASEYHRYKC